MPIAVFGPEPAAAGTPQSKLEMDGRSEAKQTPQPLPPPPARSRVQDKAGGGIRGQKPRDSEHTTQLQVRGGAGVPKYLHQSPQSWTFWGKASHESQNKSGLNKVDFFSRLAALLIRVSRCLGTSPPPSYPEPSCGCLSVEHKLHPQMGHTESWNARFSLVFQWWSHTSSQPQFCSAPTMFMSSHTTLDPGPCPHPG